MTITIKYCAVCVDVPATTQVLIDKRFYQACEKCKYDMETPDEESDDLSDRVMRVVRISHGLTTQEVAARLDPPTELEPVREALMTLRRAGKLKWTKKPHGLVFRAKN